MRWLIWTVVILVAASCKLSTKALFADKAEREKQSATAAANSSPGVKWMEAAKKSLNQPETVRLPFKTTGVFEAEQHHALGYAFKVDAGKKILITLNKKADGEGMVFTELYEPSAEPMQQTLLATIDTITNKLEYVAVRTGTLQLRVQPELMKSVEYTLTIELYPSSPLAKKP